MKPKKIEKNKAQCRKCSSVIESKYEHNFVTCPCGAISVDGGQEFLRRLGYPDDIRELSEFK